MDNYITRGKYAEVSRRVKRLQEVEIPEVAKAKMLAAEEGDLRENGGYHAAKERLELLGQQLEELQQYLISPKFIEDIQISGDLVTLGTVVKVQDVKTQQVVEYSILGPADSDPDNNILSCQTPIARGLMRKKAGEECKIPTPGGIKVFKILGVRRYVDDRD